jgi:hypothetical protein
LRHLDAVCGEFRFDGDIVFAFGMADDKHGFFICGKAAIDVGNGGKTVFVERNSGSRRGG